MLFSNRRLSGNCEGQIRAYISNECNIPKESILIFGIEMIELFLKIFPDIPLIAKIDPLDSPLNVCYNDLSEVIEALAYQKENLKDVVENFPTSRTSYEAKNLINNLTKGYADEQLKRYLKETEEVRKFLSMPQNSELLLKYESIVEEFNFKIISKRNDFHTFDVLMEYLLDLLFSRDVVLRRHKKLVRLFLFYMYWNCDIGQVDLC